MKEIDFPTKTEKSYFRCAEAVAQLSDHRCKIGCVVVNQHRIISSGHNSCSTVPLQAQIDTKYFSCPCVSKVHAETAALLPLMKKGIDLTGATLYTFRKTRDKNLAKSRPCPRCMQLIKSLGIRKIAYTTDDGMVKERLYYDSESTIKNRLYFR